MCFRFGVFSVMSNSNSESSSLSSSVFSGTPIVESLSSLKLPSHRNQCSRVHAAIGATNQNFVGLRQMEVVCWNVCGDR